MFVGIQPAGLHWNAEGALYSPTFEDLYHPFDNGNALGSALCNAHRNTHGNTHGSPHDPAQHLFLRGSNLPSRWAHREQFVILENGFGSGLNFLATWATWENDPHRPACLHYLATEAHPFQADDLLQALKPHTAFSRLTAKLGALWPVLLPGFHRLELVADKTRGRVVLTLMLGDAHTNLKQLNATVDAIFLDGFAPARNTQMWTPALFRRLRQLAAPDATLVSRYPDACVKNDLVAASFSCTADTVIAGKPKVLLANVSSKRASKNAAPQRHAIIIGAGLAGCATAERLAQRDWRIDLIEAHAAPAQEGSGNLAGIVRPVLSRDDNFISRLSRAGFLYLQRAWAQLERHDEDPAYDLSGVLQIAQDVELEMLQRERLAPGSDSPLQYPASFVQFLDSLSADRKIWNTQATHFQEPHSWPISHGVQGCHQHA
jgi:tRNA 5-methylaminomethyl-2-thiouridine biosynthesis bifunctional protein